MTVYCGVDFHARLQTVRSRIRELINPSTINKPAFTVKFNPLLVWLLLSVVLLGTAGVAGWLFFGYDRDPVQPGNKNSGEMQVGLPNVEEARQRDLGKAKKLYDLGWSLYEQADLLKQQQQAKPAQDKFAEAEAAFREAIIAGPDLAEYHSALGWALLDQYKGKEATHSFKEALSLKPRKEDLADVHYGLGLSLETLNEFKEAEYELEEAIRYAPSEKERKKYKTQLKRIQNRG